MHTRLALVVFAVLIGTVSVTVSGAAQTVTGTNGLVTVPTARMHADGTLALGAGFVNKAYSPYQRGAVDYVPIYASLTIVPSVEVGFRFSRAIDSGEAQALGDRMVLVRVRLVEEGRVLPAVAVGAHDFLRSSGELTNQFNALYAVASKRYVPLIPLAGVVHEVDAHVGFGTDALSAIGRQFVGVFGGASVTAYTSPDGWAQRWELLGEYDGNVVTVGQRLSLCGGLRLTAGVQGLKVPLVGGTYMMTM
jgi:hypothetical protein